VKDQDIERDEPAEREDRVERHEEETPLFAREADQPLKVKTGIKAGIAKKCVDTH
jgi:hypothetical protein